MVVCSREEGEEEEDGGATLGVNIFGIGVVGADALRQKENVVGEEDKYLGKSKHQSTNNSLEGFPIVGRPSNYSTFLWDMRQSAALQHDYFDNRNL